MSLPPASDDHRGRSTENEDGADPHRRRVLRATGLVGIGVIAGCADVEDEVEDENGDPNADAPPDEDDPAEDADTGLEAWFEEDDTFDQVQDMTGLEEAGVAVGVEGNDGSNAFEPSAIRVDPGTTVVWEWTGEGGTHDVTEENEAFESPLDEGSDVTFEHEFDEEGIVRYTCEQHSHLGMVGAVVVGDEEVDVEEGDDAEPDDANGDDADDEEDGES